MRLLLALTVGSLLLACPERAAPERGVQLVYRKPEGSTESVRAVIDRRLAQLKIKASLREDDRTLTVLIPDGVDAAQLKPVFLRSGKLEFCPEDETLATQWCARTWPTSIELDRGPRTCGLKAPSREVLDLALGDAGVPISYGAEGSRAVAWATYPSGCISPRVVCAEVHEGKGPPALSLEFDRAGGREFATLTEKAVGTRMLISFEGQVQSAPIVMASITGGRAMITVGSGEDLRLLAALLVGGSLPELTLEKEGRYGPPSLR